MTSPLIQRQESIALSEWRVRVKLADGKVLAGRYIGAESGHIYIGDKNTGEIHDVNDNVIIDIQIKAPGVMTL